MAIIIAAVFALGYFIFNREDWKTRKINYTPILLFGGLYLGAIVGLLNSSNTSPALFDLEQKLPLLVFPIIFFLGPEVQQKDLTNILLAFILSVLVVSIYAFLLNHGFIASHFYLGKLYWKDGRIPIDRIYLGLYSTCALGFLFCYLFFFKKVNKPISYALLVILVLTLINTFAKTAIGALLVCLLYLFYIKFTQYRKVYLISLGLLASAGITLIMFTDNTLKSSAVGLMNGFMIEGTNRNILVVNSFNERIVVYWKCAWQTVMTGNYWLVGIGAGDLQELLDNCYLSIIGESNRHYVDFHFNSHNQYFTTWLDCGMIFLLLLVFQFFLLIYKFHKIGFYEGVCFSLSVMIGCFTESMFETQKGLVFYAFFQVLFISCVFRKEGKPVRF